jgi:CHAT domain-containing protein
MSDLICYLHFHNTTGSLLMAANQVLTVRELTGRRLSLRLAILSACETGVPGTRLPDEVIGLPTALMEAGVVASFWSVADDSTAQLMAHFHRLWRQEGLAPPEALCRAQLPLRDAGYAHPFYWGPFGYTGL